MFPGVSRGDGDAQAVRADPVLGGELDRVRVARMRVQREFQPYPVRPLLGGPPRHPAGQPVDRVAPGRLGQVELPVLPVVAVGAAGHPVRPGQQDLAGAVLDGLVLRVTRQQGPDLPVDLPLEQPQPGADLGGHRVVSAAADLELTARRSR